MTQHIAPSWVKARGLLLLVTALSLGPVVGCETGDDSLGDGHPELLLDEADGPAASDASALWPQADAGATGK